MAARQMPPGMGPGMAGGLQDQDGDFPQDLADVIQTLSRAFPGNPKVAQIIADIRSLIAEGGAAHGGPAGAAGPAAGAGV